MLKIQKKLKKASSLCLKLKLKFKYISKGTFTRNRRDQNGKKFRAMLASREKVIAVNEDGIRDPEAENTLESRTSGNEDADLQKVIKRLSKVIEDIRTTSEKDYRELQDYNADWKDKIQILK